MSVYSTFFLADHDQLQTAFPDWKPPLTEAVNRTIIHPLTRDEITITTRQPEWDDFDPDDFEIPEFQVHAIEGDYETYLEKRIPPFVRSQPHWCSKGLMNVELNPLVAVVVGANHSKLEPPLYPHPTNSAALFEFPGEFVTRIVDGVEISLPTFADGWAKIMSTPEYTHSVSGQRLSEDWTTDDALRLLMPIAELARQRHRAQSLFLLIET